MIEFTLFLAFLADLFLFFVLLTIASKKEENFSFALATLSVGFWTLGIFCFRISQKLEVALFWNREFIFASGLIASNFLQFALILTGSRLNSFKKILLHSPNVLILIGVFLPKVLIKEIVSRSWGKESVLGVFYPLFAFYFSAYIAYALFKIFIAVNQAPGGRRKNQLKYIFTATLLTSIVGTYFNLFLILIGNYKYIWVGPYNSLVLAAIITLAVFRTKLFDIDLAFHYFVTWALSLTTALAFILVSFGLPGIIFENKMFQLIVGAILGTGFTALFPKYFEFYEDWSNRHILKGKYDFLEIMPLKAREWLKFNKLGVLMKIVQKDLKLILNLKTVKIILTGDWVIGSHDAAKYFYIPNPDNLDDETGFRLPKENGLIKFAERLETIGYLKDLKKDLQNPDLTESIKAQTKEAIEELEKLEVEIIIPVIYSDAYLSYIIGMICLGGMDEKTAEFMSEKDAQKLFSTVSFEASLSIQQALENRKAEIVDLKKSHIMNEAMDEAHKLAKEKEIIQKSLKKTEDQSSQMTDLASKFATKIQVLNETMENLEIMMRNSQAAVVVIRNGVIKTANKTARNFLIEPGDRILDEPYKKIFSGKAGLTNITEDIKRVLETGQASRTFETEWGKENAKVPVEIKIIPLSDGRDVKKINGAMVEVTNISEVKERQRLHYLKDKVETFRGVLMGLDHELKNATNILGTYGWTVKNLKEKALSDPQFVKDFTDAVPKAISFIEGLLKDLETSQMTLQLEGTKDTDISEAVDQVLKSFEDDFKKLKITAEKDFAKLPKIVINPEHLETIIKEAVKNSKDAIEEYDRQRELGMLERIGGKITVKGQINDRGEIEVKIIDNGVGIDDATVEKVLNPFYTTKIHSVSKPETGTGLGLNKIYNLLQLYGGSFKIESKLGEGTTVTLIFNKEVVLKDPYLHP